MEQNKNFIHKAIQNFMGEHYFGQFETDRFISSYFEEDFIGSCVEVGAVDGIDMSNTLFFEKRGWKCLCVEAQPHFAKALIQNRENGVHCAITSNADIDWIPFYSVLMNGVKTNALSGLALDQRLIDQHIGYGYDIQVEEILVPAKTLALCIQQNFDIDIDFISIDVEGTELDVLQSFNVNNYNTKLLVIENNFQDYVITEYLSQRGWRQDQRVGVNDFYVRNI